MAVFNKEKHGGKTAYKAANNVGEGVQGIFEGATGTGRVEGREGHLRLFLSTDVAQRVVG